VKRREFITLLGGAAAWPLAARAQQPTLPIVGFLSGRSPKDSMANVGAFQRGLSELGYFDGQNVEIDFRWGFGHYDQLVALAGDLVRRRVAVIVATGGGVTSAEAAKTASATTPIVFVAGTDPLEHGLIQSLNKPGGNLTGVSFLVGALMAKKVELLHQLLPKATLIGVLLNPSYSDSNAQLRDAQAAARALGKNVAAIEVSSDTELRAAFASFAQRRIEAVVLPADPFFNARAEEIAALAARAALPIVASHREYVVAGGLMSYGTSIVDAHRLAGVYAARILKGTKPADLPVVQPTQFEFVINLKTAKAFGLDIPANLLAIADEVIE
jgi:putative ABC transport system substrate-binding protein